MLYLSALPRAGENYIFFTLMGFQIENSLVIFILVLLIIAYTYVLLSPTQPRLPKSPRNFVLSK